LNFILPTCNLQLKAFHHINFRVDFQTNHARIQCSVLSDDLLFRNHLQSLTIFSNITTPLQSHHTLVYVNDSAFYQIESNVSTSFMANVSYTCRLRSRLLMRSTATTLNFHAYNLAYIHKVLATLLSIFSLVSFVAFLTTLFFIIHNRCTRPLHVQPITRPITIPFSLPPPPSTNELPNRHFPLSQFPSLNTVSNPDTWTGGISYPHEYDYIYVDAWPNSYILPPNVSAP